MVLVAKNVRSKKVFSGEKKAPEKSCRKKDF